MPGRQEIVIDEQPHRGTSEFESKADCVQRPNLCTLKDWLLLRIIRSAYFSSR
ncbi:unnamed protein product [Periconia digitata]|uniref:Uncharacterized protein n=1 Tax=Periconia digitata TaxID=1303443 RepID=A0A9W4U153_9PLEO|nr:unnamed protein product [Periconia digitata]